MASGRGGYERRIYATGADKCVRSACEQLLCYGALLSLVMAHEAGLEVKAVQEIRKKLRDGNNGPGLGDWVAILEEVARRREFRNLPVDLPLGELRSFLVPGGAADEARMRLSEHRRAVAHERLLDDVEMPHVVRERLTDLGSLYEHAEFLAELTLVEITSVRHDTLRNAS